MDQDPREKINTAVQECIRHCHGSDSILARIERFLDELRSLPNWEEFEVQIVDSRVRKLVREMVRYDPACAQFDQYLR
jgi:hypothetical protein